MARKPKRRLSGLDLLVERLGSSFPSAFLHQIRGFLAYQQEEYEAAEDECRAATVDQLTGPERLMFFTGLFGLAQVALGKREEAYAYAARLEALLSELPTGALPTAPITTCLALMAISLGDRERAANLYPVLKAFRGQYHWFLVDRVLGLLATRLHDWDRALMYLSAAKETAQRASPSSRIGPHAARARGLRGGTRRPGQRHACYQFPQARALALRDAAYDSLGNSYPQQAAHARAAVFLSPVSASRSHQERVEGPADS